jgi:hypothetical protein
MTQQDEREDDLRFMRDPSLWLYWPCLPVVHRHYGAAGVMIPGCCHVWFTNIHDLPSGSLGDILAGLQGIHYPTFEQLVDDWRVD